MFRSYVSKLKISIELLPTHIDPKVVEFPHYISEHVIRQSDKVNTNADKHGFFADYDS